MSYSAQLATVASAHQVSLRYGDVIALDGIDLDIPAGRMVGLIGPDGGAPRHSGRTGPAARIPSELQAGAPRPGDRITDADLSERFLLAQ